MFYSILAIAAGASMGAVSRWLLGTSLNSVFPSLPLGTLTANLLGAYLIGIAIAVFAALPNLAPEWRLMIVTGFLGALTTFSTFSAEITTMIQQGRFGWAATATATHVFGSFAMTMLGLGTVMLIKRY